MRRVLRCLAAALGNVMQDRYVILVLDVAPCHIHPTIYNEARRLGIRLVYIPAGLTGLLQPLDTHVFAAYKAALRRGWRMVKSTSPGGAVTPKDCLGVIFEACAFLRRTAWKSAFLDTGLLAEQGCVTTNILRAAQWDILPSRETGAPPAEDVACIFPRRRKLNIPDYVQWPQYAPSAAGPRRRILPESFATEHPGSVVAAGAAAQGVAAPMRRGRIHPMVLRRRSCAGVDVD